MTEGTSRLAPVLLENGEIMSISDSPSQPFTESAIKTKANVAAWGFLMAKAGNASSPRATGMVKPKVSEAPSCAVPVVNDPLKRKRGRPPAAPKEVELITVGQIYQYLFILWLVAICTSIMAKLNHAHL